MGKVSIGGLGAVEGEIEPDYYSFIPASLHYRARSTSSIPPCLVFGGVVENLTLNQAEHCDRVPYSKMENDHRACTACVPCSCLEMSNINVCAALSRIEP